LILQGEHCSNVHMPTPTINIGVPRTVHDDIYVK
jgi:hypothetical protein